MSFSKVCNTDNSCKKQQKQKQNGLIDVSLFLSPSPLKENRTTIKLLIRNEAEGPVIDQGQILVACYLVR